MATGDDMPNIPPEHGLVVSTLLTAGGSVSERLDTFATWLLAGFGAGMALLLDTAKSSLFVSAWSVRFSLMLFAWTVVLVVIAKYMSLVIVAASTAFDTSSKAVREAIAANVKVDTKVFSQAMVKAAPWTTRWAAIWADRKVKQGDILGAARLHMALVQFQGSLVIAEVVLFLVALGTLARNAAA